MASLLATSCLHAEEPALTRADMEQPDMALLLFLAEAEVSGTELVTPVDFEAKNEAPANSEVVEPEVEEKEQ